MIGVGDAAASLVGPEFYRRVCLARTRNDWSTQLHAMGTRVRLHICGNTTAILEPMGQLGCDIVDLDFMVPMDKARQAMGPDQVLLGNIDPVRVLRGRLPRRFKPPSPSATARPDHATLSAPAAKSRVPHRRPTSVR